MTQKNMTRDQRKAAKQKRKAMMKSILAIILALMLVGMALAPVFALETVMIGTDQMLVSDVTIRMNSAEEAVLEDYGAYIDFMMDTVSESYYKSIPQRQLIDGAYKGIFSVLDPYSTYFTPAEYKSFNTSIEGEFGGIGATITEGKSGYVEVVAPLKDTPAEKAGIMPGDRIVRINGLDAKGFTTEHAVSLIRGEVGTDVTLTIMRDGHTDLLTITITRGLIRVKSVDFEVLDSGIGYIKLNDFSEKTNAEFDAAMAHMVNNDIDKLIVDVRNNPGGLLSVATYVSDYFLPYNEEIVTIDYRAGVDRLYRANRERAPLDVVVLVNKGSASASEIFAGSIQQSGQGTVIGETSFGKGTVQNLIPLTNGGAIKMTIAEYKLKGNYQVEGNGIVPDILVPSIRGIDVSGLAPIRPASQNTSLNIYAAQQRFNLIGYSLEENGLLDNATRDVIQAFQRQKGLSITGALNQVTLETLVKHVDQQVSGLYDPQLEAAVAYLTK